MNVRRLIFRSTGKPENVLEIESIQAPAPHEGEVLVEISAAPINPADLNTIEGTYGVKLQLPGVSGIEGCGTVVASGSPEFTTGNKVMFLRRGATWATHAIIPAADLFLLPGGIDPLQAAMLKVNPATAWCLLHEVADLHPGDAIVQNLGNSAVGRCVIQLARMAGVRTVSFVRNAAQIADLTALGADAVFPDSEDGLAAAKDFLGGANAALAFNAVGGESALRLMKLLRKSGTHITYGAMGRKPLTLPNGLVIFHDIRLRGLWLTRWLEETDASHARIIYENLAALVAEAKLVQPIDSTFPLEDFPAALARLTAEDRSGKILFTPHAG